MDFMGPGGFCFDLSSCFLSPVWRFLLLLLLLYLLDCDIDPYIYIYQIMAPAVLTTTQHDESTISIMSKTLQGYEQQQQQQKQNQDNNHNDAVSTTTTTTTKQAEKKQKKKTPLEMISQGTCLPGIPTFVSFAQHRQWMLEHMALAFRVFARKGYCEGMSGHISVRDPENVHTFW